MHENMTETQYKIGHISLTSGTVVAGASFGIYLMSGLRPASILGIALNIGIALLGIIIMVTSPAVREVGWRKYKAVTVDGPLWLLGNVLVATGLGGVTGMIIGQMDGTIEFSRWLVVFLLCIALLIVGLVLALRNKRNITSLPE
jgi:hypothetical protein